MFFDPLNFIMKCAHMDAELRSSSWYARVPTKSNIADEPSRMSLTTLSKLRARIVAPYLDGEFTWFSDVLK